MTATQPYEVKVPDSYPIGERAMVKADGLLVAADVIDKIAGERRAKKVRITTGPHAGQTRMLGEFKIIEFL